MSAVASGNIATTPTTATRARINVGGIVVKVLIGLLLIVEIYPIVWLLLSSLKGPNEFSANPAYALPQAWDWQNYVQAWNSGMGNYFRNSILVTIPSLALIIVLGVGAAFGIEVMRWKAASGVLLIFLAGIMVPVQIVLLPLFTIYYNVHLLNNLLGLILTYTVFGLPLTIFLMTGYFKTIPYEVLEAGVVDGANIYQIYFRIALPMVMNSIITVALVQFFFIWNDLLLSLTFVSDANLRTIQTGLLNFVGQYGQRQWGPTFASISMAVIPTLLLYMLLNNLVIKGLTSGAVKG